jgi:flagellar biosynthesis protein
MLPRSKDRFGSAIRYDQDDDLPRIVASVRGNLVEKLIEIADEYDIPVYRDPVLARLIGEQGLEGYIPDELFPAVAEVLAYCYRIDADFREKMERRKDTHR